MLSMGLVSGAENDLGSEASGVITRVGSNINHVGVGDRVMVAFTSLFTTRRVVPGKLVAPIPEALDFAEAATLPVAYFTVLHAFLNVARLGNGEVRSQAGSLNPSSESIVPRN
jgi:NADPH:quinone reductase-like Zn-dependent oxidoreductase